MTTNTPAATGGLRAAKREQASAKAATAAKASKATAAKPAAKKAPAKAKASGQPTTKLNWKFSGEKDAKGVAPASAVSPVTGATYAIDGSGSKWTASVTPKGGKREVLGKADVSFGTAYGACTRHHKGTPVAKAAAA